MEKASEETISAEDQLAIAKNKQVELNRVPRVCPMANCNSIFYPSRLLSHFIALHLPDLQAQLRSVYESQRSVLMFNAKKCLYDENMCLGILAYAGYKGDPDTMPAKLYTSIPNHDLLLNYENYTNCLPVLLMCTRTTWPSLKPIEKMLPTTSNEDRNHIKNHHIFVLWCTTSANHLNLYVTMTVTNTKYTQAQSCIRRIRDINETSTVTDFLLTDTNYMLLTANDIKKLSDSEDETMLVEIILHEKVSVNRKV